MSSVYFSRVKSILTIYMYSFENSNVVCLAGNRIMRADISEIFMLKEYHKNILFKRRGVFSWLKKMEDQTVFSLV